MARVLTVVGARPQFIKAAVVSRALRALPGMEETILHTGQHFDDNMSGTFFEELEIPLPDVNLGIDSLPHGAMTGRMLEGIERELIRLRPDCVVVYGDTDSTLAGALAAVKLHIPVAHVEAGLRSHNRRMPEEINRIAADAVSDLLFVPTQRAADNLRREGIDGAKICLVGDVMYDAALFYAARAESRSAILARLALRAGDYTLVTIHRAENTDDAERLKVILECLCRMAAAGLHVVWPVHPRTRRALRDRRHAFPAGDRLQLLDPVGYLDMAQLVRNAALIATDSGGVQKEAFFWGIKCATLRTETEWVELVEAGWNRVFPPRDVEALWAAIENWRLQDPPSFRPPLYGDGNAAIKIADHLRAFLRR